MTLFSRISVYFAIVALLTALVPAAAMLWMVLQDSVSNLRGIGFGTHIYAIWIGHTLFYVVAIMLLAACLRRERKVMAVGHSGRPAR